MRVRLFSRGAAWRLGMFFALLGIASVWGWLDMIRMPGKSHAGALEPLDARGVLLRDQLRADVEALAGGIGHQSVLRPKGLAAAVDLIDAALASSGLSPRRQTFT